MPASQNATTLADHTILRRNTDDYLQAKLDGEMVLMHIDSAEYFGMDKTTTHIWELLEENLSLELLVQKLMSLYDVDYDTCKNDVRPVIEDMVERKFLFL